MHVCPHCGYCPHCGRSNATPFVPQPWTVPWRPWPITAPWTQPWRQPWTTTGGGSAGTSHPYGQTYNAALVI